MYNGQQPAFPTEVAIDENGIKPMQTGNYSYQTLGISKREYFACLAMQGILAGAKRGNKNGIYVNDGFIHTETVVNLSVQLADALLAALGNEKQDGL